MDDKGGSGLSDLLTVHRKMLKARVSVLPFALGGFLFVLLAALGLEALFDLEKKHAGLFLVLGWYIVIPIVDFFWAARTHLKKAAEDQAKLADRKIATNSQS